MHISQFTGFINDQNDVIVYNTVTKASIRFKDRKSDDVKK